MVRRTRRANTRKQVSNRTVRNSKTKFQNWRVRRASFKTTSPARLCSRHRRSRTGRLLKAVKFIQVPRTGSRYQPPLRQWKARSTLPAWRQTIMARPRKAPTPTFHSKVMRLLRTLSTTITAVVQAQSLTTTARTLPSFPSFSGKNKIQNFHLICPSPHPTW